MPEIGDIPPVAVVAPMAGARDAVVVGSVDGVISDANHQFCELTGYSLEELIGRRGGSLVAPEWEDFTRRQLRRKVDALEEVTRYECALLAKDGTRLPVELTSKLIRAGDEVVGVCSVLRDRRPFLAVERRISESEQRFRGAFDGAAIGVAIVGLDGRWLKVNRPLAELLGYSRDELLDLTFQDVTHPDDLDRDLESMRDVLRGRLSWYHMEKRYVRKDGAIVWGLLAVSLVRGPDGEPAYFLSQIQDVTVAKRIELAARRVREALPGTEMPTLSRRETEVLRLIADGLPTVEAATALGIGEETVQTLVKRAMQKLGARNRTHAVASALRLGLLDTAVT